MARGASVTPDIRPDGPSGPPTIDPVALLEARVKEDPRGDMDAWLNLIADYRRRSRLDDAGNAYSRFLGVFPQAVSSQESSAFVMV